MTRLAHESDVFAAGDDQMVIALRGTAAEPSIGGKVPVEPIKGARAG
jgi:hypothetical protein